jgi:hypothetical protein
MNLNSSKTSPLSVNALDFYNYFHHGVDFLMSGQTHVVRKIIIHSNMVRHTLPLRDFFCKPVQPGSPLFQRYKRCPWQLEGKPEDDEDGNLSHFHFLICVHLSIIQIHLPASTFTKRLPVLRFAILFSADPKA